MAGRMTREFAEQVRSQSDLVTVVSRYVPVKRRGNNYWGCCPFHNEDTPSFSIKSDEGFFYCFGCHVGGDVFKFLSLIENCSYWEAVALQAERLNIPLPQREMSQEELAREAKRKDLLKLHEMAGNFFHNCLTKTRYGEPGLAYFRSRSITDEIIEAFGLGYAPNFWDKLTNAFTKREVPVGLLLESGLVLPNKKNDGVYDRFRDRVIIPIADEQGRVCGFGGRIMGDGQPKYLNSPETMIFNKRRLLFGLDKAKRAISKAGFVIITEGYMDAISVYTAGVQNVVASLGTAFTEDQCRKLMRFTTELYFCYDSDNAGQTATVRAMDIARHSGARVKVITIPDCKDPDEFIRKHGPDAFKKLVEAALPMVEFHIRFVMSHARTDSLEGRVRALGEMLPVLSKINNAAELSGYVDMVSELLHISQSDIRTELGKAAASYGEGYHSHNRYGGNNNNNNSGYGEEPVRRPIRKAVYQLDASDRKAGRIVIRTIWNDLAMLDVFQEMIPLSCLDPLHQEILSKLSEADGMGASLNSIAGELSEGAAEELSRSLVEDLGGQELMVLYDDCVRSLRKKYLKVLYEQCCMEASELEQKKEKSFIAKLQEAQNIKREMDEL